MSKLMLPLNALLPLFSNSDIYSIAKKKKTPSKPLHLPKVILRALFPPSLLPYLWFGCKYLPSADGYQNAKIKDTPPPQFLVFGPWPLCTHPVRERDFLQPLSDIVQLRDVPFPLSVLLFNVGQNGRPVE